MFLVPFKRALERVLPGDIPHRDQLIEASVRHLQMITAANEYMNLTRLTSPEEAAIKHVYDSVAPWQCFAGVSRILDAGTGAGFPGIPLAVIFPEAQFTLAESVGKKARFVESVVRELGLKNTTVVGERAETLALKQSPELITARALAPLDKLLDLFNKSVRRGARLLLYKGPEVEAEIRHVAARTFELAVVSRYELPDEMGSRTLVEVRFTAHR